VRQGAGKELRLFLLSSLCLGSSEFRQKEKSAFCFAFFFLKPPSFPFPGLYGLGVAATRELGRAWGFVFMAKLGAGGVAQVVECLSSKRKP
jgi:hypothetical protein